MPNPTNATTAKLTLFLIAIRCPVHAEFPAGSRGPITEELQKLFFAEVEGRVDDTHGWLTPVYPDAGA